MYIPTITFVDLILFCNRRKSIPNCKIWLTSLADTETKVVGEENRDSAAAVVISSAVQTSDDRAATAKTSKDPAASTTEVPVETSATKDLATMINN